MLDLEAIKARAAAATPGPWYHSGYGWNIVSAGDDGVSVSTRQPQTYLDGTQYDPAPDAQFIAHAREDVPNLVAVVEALQAALDTLVEEAESTYGDYCEDVWGPRQGLRDAVDAACELLGRPKPD